MGFLAAIPVGIWAAISAGGAAVGAGTSIAGAVVGANAEASAGEQAARQAQWNSVLARRAAVDAESRGNTQAAQARGMGTKVIGAQRAAFGASGVDVQSGIAQDLAGATGAMSEMDAATARSNAASEAWGYKSQASQFLQQGQQAQAAAGAAGLGAGFGATGGALSMVGNFATAYGRPKLGK